MTPDNKAWKLWPMCLEHIRQWECAPRWAEGFTAVYQQVAINFQSKPPSGVGLDLGKLSR